MHVSNVIAGVRWPINSIIAFGFTFVHAEIWSETMSQIVKVEIVDAWSFHGSIKRFFPTFPYIAVTLGAYLNYREITRSVCSPSQLCSNEDCDYNGAA